MRDSASVLEVPGVKFSDIRFDPVTGAPILPTWSPKKFWRLWQKRRREAKRSGGDWKRYRASVAMKLTRVEAASTIYKWAKPATQGGTEPGGSQWIALCYWLDCDFLDLAE